LATLETGDLAEASPFINNPMCKGAYSGANGRKQLMDRFETVGMGPLLSSRIFIPQEDYPRTEGFAIHELKGQILSQRLKHGFSFSKDYRPKIKPVFIDEAKLDKGGRQFPAADRHILSRSLF
jgi:hypothetical protein